MATSIHQLVKLVSKPQVQRGSSSSINSSSSSSSINNYINTDNDDDDDFQDFFNSMEDPRVANLNKIQMLKFFYLFVIAKSMFLLFKL